MSRTKNPAIWPQGTCRTPAWLTRAILPHLCSFVQPEVCRERRRYILDLGCGDGAIGEVLALAGFPVVGIDKRPEVIARIPAPLTDLPPFQDWPAGIHPIVGDVLDPKVIARVVADFGDPAAVVMNSPFSLLEEGQARPAFRPYDPAEDGVRAFIEVARRLMDPGAGERNKAPGPIFALARCAWWLEIEGRDAYRAELVSRNVVTLRSTARRPGFYPDNPKKTDSTAYTWIEIEPVPTNSPRLRPGALAVPLVLEPVSPRRELRGTNGQ